MGEMPSRAAEIARRHIAEVEKACEDRIKALEEKQAEFERRLAAVEAKTAKMPALPR